MKKGELFVATQVAKEEQIVEGYRKEDLAAIGVATCVYLVLGIFLYLQSRNTILALCVGFFLWFVTAFIFRRDTTGENLIDHIRIYFKYQKSCKQFFYQYHLEGAENGRGQDNNK